MRRYNICCVSFLIIHKPAFMMITLNLHLFINKRLLLF